MKKIFKNWKSKKQLKEENIRLQTLLSAPVQIHRVERDIMPYRASFILEDNMSIEFAKHRIAEIFAEDMLNNDLIEWNINDEMTPKGLGKKVTGTVYIARRYYFPIL